MDNGNQFYEVYLVIHPLAAFSVFFCFGRFFRCGMVKITIFGVSYKLGYPAGGLLHSCSKYTEAVWEFEVGRW
jgi:hypothetical protein